MATCRMFAVAVALSFSVSTVEAATITLLDGSQGWTTGNTQGGGTATIVDLAGQGGNLENNAPLPSGAARLTTTSDVNDRAEITHAGDFGIVSQIFDGELSFSYSVFKVPGGPAEAAPALKLSFLNASASGDNFVTLIFEPYWNQPGFEATSQPTPAGNWDLYAVDLDSGLFWQNGGFGQSGSAGGPPLKTLSEWMAAFSEDFQSANLVAVAFGLGTYNPDQVGYLDKVGISGTALDDTFDFEVAPVPLPAAFPVFAAGIAGIGVISFRRRRKNPAGRA